MQIELHIFEGPDDVGKTTLIAVKMKQMKERMKEKGVEIYYYKERSITKDSTLEEVLTERAAEIAKLQQWMKERKDCSRLAVYMDRFLVSTLVYQPNNIEELEEIVLPRLSEFFTDHPLIPEDVRREHRNGVWNQQFDPIEITTTMHVILQNAQDTHDNKGLSSTLQIRYLLILKHWGFYYEWVKGLHELFAGKNTGVMIVNYDTPAILKQLGNNYQENLQPFQEGLYKNNSQEMH